MRPEGSLQLSASSWQYWLHPESHRTRGFNTEPWCSSPEGITGAVLREMDPQHSYSQGCPASTHLQYTHTHTHTHTQTQTHVQTHSVHTQTEEHGIFTLSHSHSSLAHLAIVHSPVLSLTHIHTQTVTHYRWCCSYASYGVHIPRSPPCQIMRSPFICSPISFFKPSHTIITTLHSVTRKYKVLYSLM